MRFLLPALLLAVASCSAADLLTQSHTDSTDGGNNPGDTAEFAIQISPDSDFAGALASDGSHCLVTSYHGNRGSNGSVAAQLVADTRAVSQPVGLGQNVGDLPVAAFDGNEYLVLHVVTASDGSAQLSAQFIDRTGARMGSDIQLTTQADGAIAAEGLAFGGGTFLALYDRDADQAGLPAVYVRTVSTTGQVGAETELSPSSGSDRLDFDGQNFFATYAPPGTDELDGRFIAPTGVPGKSLVIANSSGQRFNSGASVAFSGGNHLVVYSSHPTGTDRTPAAIYAQAVSPTGTLVGSPALLPSSAGDFITSVVPTPTGFAAAFQTGTIGSHSTIAQLYSASGTPQGNVLTLLAPDSQVKSRSAQLCPVSGGKFLAVIQEIAATPGANLDIYGKIISVP